MEQNPYSAPIAFDDSATSFDRRWLIAMPLIVVVAVFATLDLMLALLCLLACNSIAFAVLLIVHQTTAAKLAFLTGVLVLATLIFTNWGFSMPNPRIRVSWVCFIPACVSQMALILTPIWLSRLQRVDLRR